MLLTGHKGCMGTMGGLAMSDIVRRNFGGAGHLLGVDDTRAKSVERLLLLWWFLPPCCRKLATMTNGRRGPQLYHMRRAQDCQPNDQE